MEGRARASPKAMPAAQGHRKTSFRQTKAKQDRRTLEDSAPQIQPIRTFLLPRVTARQGFSTEENMPEKLEIIQSDITQVEVDAIVNAANQSLLGGGGVDGAIHRKAGPLLCAECATLGGCQTGEAKITKGYHLPARHVIHTVGPIWKGGKSGEPELLVNCYRNCFALAHSNHLKTIAFPSISTGAYGYPISKACRIALAQIEKASIQYPELEKIMVVCFDQHTYEAYQSALKERER